MSIEERFERLEQKFNELSESFAENMKLPAKMQRPERYAAAFVAVQTSLAFLRAKSDRLAAEAASSKVDPEMYPKEFVIHADEEGRPSGCWPKDHPQRRMLAEDSPVELHTFWADSAEEALAFARGYSARFFDESERKFEMADYESPLSTEELRNHQRKLEETLEALRLQNSVKPHEIAHAWLFAHNDGARLLHGDKELLREAFFGQLTELDRKILGGGSSFDGAEDGDKIVGVRCSTCHSKEVVKRGHFLQCSECKRQWPVMGREPVEGVEGEE